MNKHPLAGRKLSKEHKHKISLAHKGKVILEETKKKISETKKKNSKPAWNKGIPTSNEVKEKLSRALYFKSKLKLGT